MPVSENALHSCIHALASVEGMLMDPRALTEDVLLLAEAFPDEADFLLAAASTRRALEQCARGTITPTALDRSLAGWLSYHYQHKVGQGQQADMRVVYRETDRGIEVKGFGHRWLPADVYGHVSGR